MTGAMKSTKGFFGRIGQGLADFGAGAKDLATKSVKALGGGLNYLSGGNHGKLGNFLQDQYKNASEFARKQYDRVTAIAKRLKGTSFDLPLVLYKKLPVAFSM